MFASKVMICAVGGSCVCAKSDDLCKSREIRWGVHECKAREARWGVPYQRSMEAKSTRFVRDLCCGETDPRIYNFTPTLPRYFSYTIRVFGGQIKILVLR